MKGGYQILDLKGVDLNELNGTTKVINLTDEEVKGLKSGKPILLNNVNFDEWDVPAQFMSFSGDERILGLINVDDKLHTISIIVDVDNKKITRCNLDEVLDSLQQKLLPTRPATTANKTYVLKLVNGNLTWVEETE